MKVIKFILKTILVLAVLLLVAVVALPLWIGPVVCKVANSMVPEITGTGFRMEKFDLNPYTGKIGGYNILLENPTNVTEKYAVDLSSVKVDVDVGSVLTEKIHIREVLVDGLIVHLTMNASNFKEIGNNASAWSESGAAETNEVTATANEPGAPKDGKAAKEGGTKVLIDKIILRNMTLKYTMMPIRIPEIIIENIGAEDEGGASLDELWGNIYDVLMKSVVGVGKGVKLTKESLQDLGSGLLSASSNALGGVSVTVSNSTEALDATLDETDKLFKETGKTLKETGKSLKQLFKDARKQLRQ